MQKINSKKTSFCEPFSHFFTKLSIFSLIGFLISKYFFFIIFFFLFFKFWKEQKIKNIYLLNSLSTTVISPIGRSPKTVDTLGTAVSFNLAGLLWIPPKASAKLTTPS